MNRQKVIKSIATRYYEVELIADSDDMYKIKFELTGFSEPKYSEPIQDLNVALKLFDIKVREVEGH